MEPQEFVGMRSDCEDAEPAADWPRLADKEIIPPAGLGREGRMDEEVGRRGEMEKEER